MLVVVVAQITIHSSSRTLSTGISIHIGMISYCVGIGMPTPKGRWVLDRYLLVFACCEVQLRFTNSRFWLIRDCGWRSSRPCLFSCVICCTFRLAGQQTRGAAGRDVATCPRLAPEHPCVCRQHALGESCKEHHPSPIEQKRARFAGHGRHHACG